MDKQRNYMMVIALLFKLGKNLSNNNEHVP